MLLLQTDLFQEPVKAVPRVPLGNSHRITFAWLVDLFSRAYCPSCCVCYMNNVSWCLVGIWGSATGILCEAISQDPGTCDTKRQPEKPVTPPPSLQWVTLLEGCLLVICKKKKCNLTFLFIYLFLVSEFTAVIVNPYWNHCCKSSTLFCYITVFRFQNHLNNQHHYSFCVLRKKKKKDREWKRFDGKREASLV